MTYSTFFIWILGILYVLSCVILIFSVLLQEGKSGGMAGMDSVSQAPSALTDTLGVGGAHKSMFKATSIFAGLFFVLALTLTLLGNARDKAGGNLELPSATPEMTAPALPVSEQPASEAPGAPAENEPAPATN